MSATMQRYETYTPEELRHINTLLGLTGAHIDEHGDIRCNLCGKTNECCTCGTETEEDSGGSWCDRCGRSKEHCDCNVESEEDE